MMGCAPACIAASAPAQSATPRAAPRATEAFMLGSSPGWTESPRAVAGSGGQALADRGEQRLERERLSCNRLFYTAHMRAMTAGVLRLLADGEFHSGEALARALDVSRASVWNAVRELEAMQLDVYKVHGRGYRLPQPLSMLDRAEVERHLGAEAERFALDIRAGVDSTSTLLLERAAAGAPAGAVVAAEWQAAGRGRFGRAWHAGVGGALAFSLLWRFAQGAGALSGLSLAVGVALARALEAAGARGVALKWPNDVLAGRRKMAGALAEAHWQGEELQAQLEAEFQKQLEEEKQRLSEEQRRRFEAERERIQLDAQQKAEQERQRQAEEERKQADETRRKEEEEEQHRQQELEAKRLREAEETRRYEEAVREAIEEGRRLAQAKKIRSYVDRGKELIVRNQFEEALKEVTKVFLLNPSHEEARSLEQTIYASRQEFLRREEEARRLQEEQQRKLEEIRQKLEEQERKDREEEERRAIRNAKISETLRRAEEYVSSGAHERALSEIETVYAMDPGNTAAQQIEVKILSAQKKKVEAKAVPQQRSSESEAWKKEEEEKERIATATRELLRLESMSTFRSMLKQAWVDGQPTKEERAMVEVVRRSLGVSDGDHAALEREVQLEAYTEALRSAWKAGIVSSDDVATRENLRAMYGISSEDHLTVEATLRREMSQDSTL